MVGLFVRALLAVVSGAAALLVSRDAPNFPILQGMLALVAAVLALVAAAVLQPAAAWLFRRRASPRSRPWAP